MTSARLKSTPRTFAGCVPIRWAASFSVFRIYVAPKTGGPAKYSKDNVPYHPKKWAPVSLQGYVLYMMESWGKADRLIKEIGAK